MADSRGREGHYAFSFDRVSAALWDKYEGHQQVESVEVLVPSRLEVRFARTRHALHEQSSDDRFRRRHRCWKDGSTKTTDCTPADC